MQIVAKQLELSLWENLETAITQPEAADLSQLWQDLEQAIAKTDKDQQLLLAGEAIAQIVEVYVLRVELLLATLEVRDSSCGPVLSEDFLDGLMRQSMTIDLSDMTQEDWFTREEQEPPAQVAARGSVAAPVNKKLAKAIADQARIDAKQMLAELAGQERVSQWAAAIAQWMQQHDGKAVSLLQLQQGLGMPLVDG